MLFCIDYAVNKNCSGMFLYRVQDDLWFWNSDPAQCAKAWETMTSFADTVGLEFNQEKTGAICIGGPLNPRFPVGEIRWGLLKLDYSGRFIIDQALVDTHIKDLQHQLAACESIFSWVYTYNTYLRYLLRKFAAPTRCFGVRHLMETEKTLQRIHAEIFPEHNGSVISYLASVISHRFSITNIPTGWFFWPTRLGGLEVYNPFIGLNAIRFGGNLPYDPNEGFQRLVAHDREKFERKKKAWKPQPHTEFMTFEEYLSGRESRDMDWASVYMSLLEAKAKMAAPRVFPAPNLREVNDVLAEGDGRGRNIDVYWKWIMMIWGQEMVERWGGYCIVRDELLPLGIVSVLRKEGVAWEMEGVRVQVETG